MKKLIPLVFLLTACGGTYHSYHRHGVTCHTVVQHFGGGHTRTTRTCHHY